MATNRTYRRILAMLLGTNPAVMPWSSGSCEDWTSFGKFESCLRPIVQESLQPNVCKGMLDHFVQNVRRHGRDMCSQFRRLNHVNRVANACNKNIGFDVIVTVNLEDVLNNLHAYVSGVIQAPDE